MSKRTRRTNGEGYIRERIDGRWEFALRLRDGKRVSIYADSRVKLLRKIADERAKNGGELRSNSPETLADYVQRWLDHDVTRNRKASTAATYESVMRNQVLPRIGKLQLARITPMTIDKLYEELVSDGYGKATIQKTHQVLHRALKVAVRKGVIRDNPVSRVEPPRYRSQAMRALTPLETKRLLEAAEGDPLEALYVLAARTGMRLGELLALRWEDVNWSKKTVAVRYTLQEVKGVIAIVEPKTSSSKRVIDLGDAALSALRRRQQIAWSEAAGRSQRNRDPRRVSRRRTAKALKEECVYVFLGAHGEHIRRSNLYKRSFKPLLSRAGIGKMRFHDLRHTAATLMLLAGVHPKTVADRLGHASVRITLDRYSHVLPGMGKDAAERTDALLANA